MPYVAVIFDLDGTLLDTLADLASSMNRVLAARGLPEHPVDSYRYFVGQGMKNLAFSAAPAGTDEKTVNAIRLEMAADYGENWNRTSRPYDGIPEMLETLRSRGVRLGVLSNKPDQFTQVMIQHYFPTGIFQTVRGAKDGIPIKPDPTGAVLMAKELGAPVRDAMYVGDTDTDMLTGLAAGMATVGVTWGFRPEELDINGVKAIASSPEELTRLALGG